MCFLCGNDFSQQEYDRNSYLLKEKISDLETDNAQLNISLINKESHIYNLEVKLKELEDKENDKDEYDINGNSSHSAIELLEQVLNATPYPVKVSEVAEFESKISDLLNEKITSEIGYLNRISLNEMRSGLLITITYNIYDYNKKDLIIFKELMMKTIDNKDLTNEMGWVRNYSMGVDLFISRSEVGFCIKLNKESESDSYYYNFDASEYVNALSFSRYLID